MATLKQGKKLIFVVLSECYYLLRPAKLRNFSLEEFL
jgi:hypothetical protein